MCEKYKSRVYLIYIFEDFEEVKVPDCRLYNICLCLHFFTFIFIKRYLLYMSDTDTLIQKCMQTKTFYS